MSKLKNMQEEQYVLVTVDDDSAEVVITVIGFFGLFLALFSLSLGQSAKHVTDGKLSPNI